MKPELPPDLSRVLLKIGAEPAQQLVGRSDTEGVPEAVLHHMADLAIVVYERDRIEVVRAIIGGRTLVSTVQIIEDTRYVLVTELMTGHQFMKSLRRWASRWLVRLAEQRGRRVSTLPQAGAA